MDRNLCVAAEHEWDLASLSARRAWIEMALRARLRRLFLVALRKESVDRNFGLGRRSFSGTSRSPQGERG